MPYHATQPIALCIPRIEDGITDRFVKDIFTELELGEIKSVVFRKANKTNARKAFINLYSWNTNEIAQRIKTRLKADLPVNIMYKIPWYWKIKLAYSD